MEGETRQCKDCGGNYFVSGNTKQAMIEKGWDIPKRCKPCREQKKVRDNSPFNAAKVIFKGRDKK